MKTVGHDVGRTSAFLFTRAVTGTEAAGFDTGFVSFKRPPYRLRMGLRLSLLPSQRLP